MAVPLDFTTPHVLRTEAEYDAAAREIDVLLERHPRPGSTEHDRLEFLSVLIAAYDDGHYAMGQSTTPQSVVDFMLEQKGLTRASLAGPMGGRSRVSDFFAKKRGLSLGQIRKLRDLLGVPADLLVPPPARRRVRSAPRATRLGGGGRTARRR